MTSDQATFLKSCFRLPGLSPEITLSSRKFLNSEAFVFFVLKQIEHLSLPGLSISADKYLLVGTWGFTASLSVNGQKEILVVVLREEDSFRDALLRLIAAVNSLIVKTRGSLSRVQQPFIKRLLGMFAYRPAPPILHLIDTGSDCYIGYLPETVNADVRINDISRRDMIQQAAFPFPAFSYQPEKESPLALVVNAWESADPRLLSKFTGLAISNRGGWHISEGERKVNLNCADHYENVTDAINILTQKTGARLYLQPYPWNKELLFFITQQEEERYSDFLVSPDNGKNYRATDRQLKLELTEAYVNARPDDIAALGELTTCYGNLDEHQKAFDLTEEYLLLAPDNYVLRNNKLIALVHLHLYEDALEAGKETLKIREHSWNTHYFMGVAYTQLEEYDEAFSALQFCVREAPDQPFHWFALGYVYYKTGDYDQAIKHYRQCVETSELYEIKEEARVSSWYNMACIYSVQNKIEASRNAYIEALRLNPEYKTDLFEDEELENLKNAVDAEELFRMAGV